MKRFLAALSILASPALADTYTSTLNLPPATLPFSGSEVLQVVQAGQTRQAPIQAMLSLVSANLSGGVSIDSFGAKGDGVTNDNVALGLAFLSLGNKGGFVELGCKDYAFSGFTIPKNVTVKHCRGENWHGEPAEAGAVSQILTQPHVNLTAGSITLPSNGGYTGAVFRAGVALPATNPDSYNGTAFVIPDTGPARGKNNVRVDALVVGFARCFDSSDGNASVYAASPRTIYHADVQLECDGNPGPNGAAVYIGTSADTSYWRVRTWPWGTYATSGGVNTRSGAGIYIGGIPQDDTIFRNLLDFGHTNGVVLAASGNYHINHLWTDNSTSWGVWMIGGDRIRIDYLQTATTKGIRTENGVGGISIGMAYCDNAVVASASCLEVGGSTEVLQISHLLVRASTSFPINIGSTTAKLRIGSAEFANTGSCTAINNGLGPYIVGPPGWTTDQVIFATPPVTDCNLPAGSVLFGGNQITAPTIASASSINLPVTATALSVTGTNVIQTLIGSWDQREITLNFASTASVVTTGNISLSSASFLGSPGAFLRLRYNIATGKWMEIGRGPIAAAGATQCGSATVDMNTTADQAIILVPPSQNYVFQSVRFWNPSVSLASGSASGGIYSGPGKTGTQIIGASNTYAALTTNTPNTTGNMIVPAIANNVAWNSSTVYFSLTGASGFAATARVSLYCIPLQ